MATRQRIRKPEGSNLPAESTAEEREETRSVFVRILDAIVPGGPARVLVNLVVNQVWEIPLRDKGNAKPVRVDVSLFSVAGILKVWEYGLRRYLRDGAQTSEPVKDQHGKQVYVIGKDGSKKKKTRKFSESECDADAEANAARKLAGLYSGDIREREGGIDPLAEEYRSLLVKFACKAGRDSEGNPLTQKTVPAALARARTVEDARTAAAAMGFPENRIAELLKSAKAVVRTRTIAPEDEETFEVRLA